MAISVARIRLRNRCRFLLWIPDACYNIPMKSIQKKIEMREADKAPPLGDP